MKKTALGRNGLIQQNKNEGSYRFLITGLYRPVERKLRKGPIGFFHGSRAIETLIMGTVSLPSVLAVLCSKSICYISQFYMCEHRASSSLFSRSCSRLFEHHDRIAK